MKFKLSGTGIAALSLFAATFSAQAADMPRPVYKGAHSVVPYYNWTGLYAGVNLGGAKADGSSFVTQGAQTTTVSMSSTGVVGGGQLGYNLQLGAVVWGVETDFQLTSLRASTSGTFAGNPYSATAKIPYFGTTRARVGYTMNGWMPYITAGVAYGQFQGAGTVPTGNFSNTIWGAWTAGAGVEMQLMGRWTYRVEYLYLDTGHHTNTYTGGATTDSKVTVNVVRVGLNYRF